MLKQSQVELTTEEPANGQDSGSQPRASLSRRSFLSSAAAATMLSTTATRPAFARVQTATEVASVDISSFIDVVRVPDHAFVYAGLESRADLVPTAGVWRGKGIALRTVAADDALTIYLSSPRVAPTHIHLRWSAKVDPSLLVLGDHWERSYGDLEWRHLIPERVMPWYFATTEPHACHVYGVKTGARSLCFWQLDGEGVSLWLNVSNGGSGVHLGNRELLAAKVVARKGQAGEDAPSAIRSFCKQMCSKPSLSLAPIYGTNDWYYAYGKNTAGQILRDTELVASLSKGNTVRPFSVIDAGWENGPPAFPDMAKLAAKIRGKQVRPGIWVRPLKAEANTPAHLLLPAARFASIADQRGNPAVDPTHPEAQAFIRARIQQVAEWGYDLIKHDFSTYDLLGQWGFQMGASPTLPGWSLQDTSKTNAEVILDLYSLIRDAAGTKTVILGCNTIGHLTQGIFEAQRTGDDTSGKLWERTRRMGVNTLAYRLPQHKTFFVNDADCVGLTTAIPWELNKQWLDLIARTGTALFISPQPEAIGQEQKDAIQQAFARVASGAVSANPADWFDSTVPELWSPTVGERTQLRYRWCEPNGANAFTV